MTKTTEANLDDRMGDLDEIRSSVSEADDALSNADSVETPEDFDASIDEAIDALKTALKDLKALRS